MIIIISCKFLLSSEDFHTKLKTRTLKKIQGHFIISRDMIPPSQKLNAVSFEANGMATDGADLWEVGERERLRICIPQGASANGYGRLERRRGHAEKIAVCAWTLVS